MGGAAGGGLCAPPHVPGCGDGPARLAGSEPPPVCAWLFVCLAGWRVWLWNSLPTPTPIAVCAALPASRSVTLPELVLGEGMLLPAG